MSESTHPNHDDYDHEGLDKVRSLIENMRTCMLTSVDLNGGLVARPMATQEVEFDGDMWFFTEADAPKVANIEADPRVNVGFVDDSVWVSVKGQADIVRDDAKKEELWNPFAAAWFTEGPSDPNIVLIRVHAESAEYWDSPGKVATAVAMVKTKIAGGTPDVGDNETVDLQ